MTEREQKAFEEWFEKEVRPYINMGRIANSAYFHYKNGWGAALEWQNSTLIEDRYGHEPEKCSACDGTGDMDLSKPCDPSILDSANVKCRDCNGTGYKPDKVKPLAKYLTEYLKHEIVDVDLELLEQALDAYQSTENVKIRIEPV